MCLIILVEMQRWAKIYSNLCNKEFENVWSHTSSLVTFQLYNQNLTSYKFIPDLSSEIGPRFLPCPIHDGRCAFSYSIQDVHHALFYTELLHEAMLFAHPRIIITAYTNFPSTCAIHCLKVSEFGTYTYHLVIFFSCHHLKDFTGKCSQVVFTITVKQYCRSNSPKN